MCSNSCCHYYFGNIIRNKCNLLEAGRSCVQESYRDGRIIRLLWRGITTYIKKNEVDLIFGCASFPSANYLEFTKQLNKANNLIDVSTIFAYPVLDPQRYGVVEFDNECKAIKIEEKPKSPSSRFAITGLYFYDSSIVDKAKTISPSPRGELEITSINQLYLREGLLKVEIMGRGMTWLDTGTFDSLQEAGAYIKTLENRQGLKIGSPEEVAWRNSWIDNDQLKKKANQYLKSGY